ncbi:MAG: hypothetical protein JSV62_09675 [Promethearchaeota archaeon]|nr:MAG: hypothetical protein JSV62_09675 [Candidatus Lokiarchaeota archaeon]
MNEEPLETEVSESSEDNNEVVKEEVSLQFHLYIFIFFVIYYVSWLIPGFLFWLYFFLPFRIFFLENIGFISIFTDLSSLISLLVMPLVIIGCYLLHQFLIGLMTRFIWRITEKISPSKSGVIPRNIRSKAANYYHIRSFMIKYGKNSYTKGIFPWLSNWFFKFVGSNKIGKGTTFEESVGNDKFIEIGKNSYIGVNFTCASHLIQGIFGNISYFKIKIGDNFTAAAMGGVGPGSEVDDDCYLLPFAATPKHSIIKGGKNYYIGLPMRRIFRKKIMNYLGLTPKDLEMNENIEGYKDKALLKKLKKKRYSKENFEDTKTIEESDEIEEDKININNLTEEDLAIDFTTSSSISRVNIKFLIVYIPIFWISGLLITMLWYWFSNDFVQAVPNRIEWSFLFFFPIFLFGMVYIFILACILFSKLFLLIVNLIHKPKEGVFKAEIGDTDFEFWALRTEVKKIALWMLRNSPFPWTDVVALILYGVNMDTSSHLNDAWCDAEFITFGRQNLIGQGANIMSSMVVGKYLLIKKVIFGDYVMIGGHTTISPGTFIGKESFIGAVSTSTYDQYFKPGWIFLGIPARELKENKYAEERRDILIKRQVDEAMKFTVSHEVNIDDDKKQLIKTEEEVKEK